MSLPAATPAVSVLVPVYRNAETLEPLAERLRSALGAAGLGYELLFVVDASPDDSLEVARALARRDPAVGVLGLGRNLGQQGALLAGLAWARGDWVVLMDGDLQDPPEAIPALLAAGRRGFGAVFAGRRGRYESWHRLLTSRLYKAAMQRLAGLPRDAGLFVALSRALVDALLQGPGGAPWLLPRIALAGLPVTSVPVARAPRPVGSSSYSGALRLRVAFASLAWAAGRRWWPPRQGTARPAVEIAVREGCCAGPGKAA